jgi:hypothetical protein
LRGIGLVQVLAITARPGQPIRVEIRYFRGLDQIIDADLKHSGNGSDGRYEDYALAVGQMAEIRWRKRKS